MFHIVVEVFKHADSYNEKVCDLNAKECGKDDLKSKHVEKVSVQKGEESTATR